MATYVVVVDRAGLTWSYRAALAIKGPVNCPSEPVAALDFTVRGVEYWLGKFLATRLY